MSKPFVETRLKFQSACYLSLFFSLSGLYRSAIKEADSYHPSDGINARSKHGLTAMILTVTVWESYLNFIFLSPWTERFFGTEVAQKIKTEEYNLKKTKKTDSLFERTQRLPLYVRGQSFSAESESFRDFEAIIAIRHRLIHNFSQQDPADKHLLRAFPKVGLLHSDEHRIDYMPWEEKLCTTEAIRWCIKTLSDLATELNSLIDPDPKQGAMGFPKYGVEDAKDLFKKRRHPRVPHELYFPTGK